jgi:alkanesulfonate monooxygenase SsuD/methylene tetrahydromethanopterin reductase-like flavin-dependent oxidoreductase (luciferase family)
MEFEPLQKPYPPLWYGAHSPDSAERAARKGLNIVTNDNVERAQKILARYQEVWSGTGRAGPLPKMGLVRFIVLADTDAAAMNIARRAYQRWRSSFVYLSALNGALPDSPLNVESFDHLVRLGYATAGAPETVRAFLEEQIEVSGANYVVGQFCFGDLSLSEMLRSVELFAAHVMPKLRDALGELSSPLSAAEYE